MENDLKRLLRDIKKLILSARGVVVQSVDVIQVMTNFEIGRRIVEQEQKGSERAEYGKKILKTLSEYLSIEFGRGFSLSNLKLMRQFYQQNPNRIGQTVSGQLWNSKKAHNNQQIECIFEKGIPLKFTLSWSHYVFLLGVKDLNERSFYEIEATSQSWSLAELKRQFNSGYYERLALSRNKDEIRKMAQNGLEVTRPQDLLKAPYILEFLGIDEQTKYSESDLETAIIDKLGQFLLELGKGFLFEARQKRFTFQEDHFFVDLVFYNRLLRCYVLIDLKIGKLTHQDLGQMQMYVNYFDRYVKQENETPTIGIILCKKKHDALVEITLPKNANIDAQEYQLYLPDKEELKKKLIQWSELLGSP